MGFGAFTKLFQRGRLNVCVADIHDEPEAFPEVVGTLHNNVQSLDASGGYISLGGNLSFAAFKIESDQNLKLVVQKTSPLMLAATLRPGRDAATENYPNPNVMHVTAKRLNVAESQSSTGNSQKAPKQPAGCGPAPPEHQLDALSPPKLGFGGLSASVSRRTC